MIREVNTLDELERLEKSATPGPWSASETAVYANNQNVVRDAATDEDAALIAAARNHLDDLLKIARAMAELSEVEQGGWRCVACGAVRGEGYRIQPHDDDCAWLLARRLAGGAP